MAQIDANGIQLEYETFGNKSQPAVLLIIGLSCQMIHWPADFCQKLADKGYFVIRYDNRDTGLSTKFHHAGVPDIQGLIASMMMGLRAPIPYDLNDLADDAAALLEALNIRKAHVCGMSMGGMIAQALAINYPESVRSLTSIYSTTGNPMLPPPTPEAMIITSKRPPAEKNAYIDHTVEVYRILGGNGPHYDVDFNRMMAAQAFDRSYYPEGTGRQLAAILTQKDRREQLAKLSIPTLIVHGDKDPLVALECGRDTAATISQAQFVLIEGMGHELPSLNSPHWKEIFKHLTDHLAKA